MPTTATNVYSGKRLEPAQNPDLARTMAVNFPASIAYAKGTILGEAAGTNAIQSLTIGGVPTGGTTRLTFGGQQTAAIAFNAEAAAVQAALGALSTIGPGNVIVTGGPWPNSPMFVQFVGALGGAVRAAITAADSFTGGTSPATTIATTQAGAAGTRGTYKAYVASAVDGSQVPIAVLEYDISTDASGNVTLTDVSGQVGNEWGATRKTAPVYTSGYFRIEDLPLTGTGALDGQVLLSPGFRVVEGSIAAGAGIIGLGV